MELASVVSASVVRTNLNGSSVSKPYVDILQVSTYLYTNNKQSQGSSKGQVTALYKKITF